MMRFTFRFLCHSIMIVILINNNVHGKCLVNNVTDVDDSETTIIERSSNLNTKLWIKFGENFKTLVIEIRVTYLYYIKSYNKEYTVSRNDIFAEDTNINQYRWYSVTVGVVRRTFSTSHIKIQIVVNNKLIEIDTHLHSIQYTVDKLSVSVQGDIQFSLECKPEIQTFRNVSEEPKQEKSIGHTNPNIREQLIIGLPTTFAFFVVVCAVIIVYVNRKKQLTTIKGNQDPSQNGIQLRPLPPIPTCCEQGYCKDHLDNKNSRVNLYSTIPFPRTRPISIDQQYRESIAASEESSYGSIALSGEELPPAHLVSQYANPVMKQDNKSNNTKLEETYMNME